MNLDLHLYHLYSLVDSILGLASSLLRVMGVEVDRVLWKDPRGLGGEPFELRPRYRQHLAIRP